MKTLLITIATVLIWLLANGKLDFFVSKNVHVFFKNFSNENLKITN